jgi:sialidase-1
MRRLLAILAIGLTALLEPGAVGASAARAGSCSWTPFTSRMNSVRGPYYRVPSVVRARNGWLVAFAERRDNNGTRDDGNFDIVRSISTNNGCSWKAPKVLQDAGTHRVSNPLPILDAITGRIYLMTSVRTDKNYLYVSRSDTNGSTWTKPRRLVKPADGITGWRGGLTAPGNGIQLSSGPHKGRLLFSIGAVDHQGRYRVDVVASDDHGRSWKVTASVRPPRNTHIIEPSIVQLGGDTVFLTAHDQLTRDRLRPRYRAISTNGGTGFGTNRFVTMKTPTMVSVYVNTLVPTGAGSVLLMSGPSLAKRSDPTLRKDPAIWISKDKGRTWSKPHRIAAAGTQGSYTNMVQLSRTTIGVLYETGKRSWKERISFKRIKLSTLTR